MELNAARPGVFRIDESPWSRDIDDETLKRRFAEALAVEEGALDLASAALLLIAEKRWSDRMEESLLKAWLDDLVVLFREHQGDTLRLLIEHLYRAANMQGAETQPIAGTVSAALDQISKESKLNEIRIRRWRK